MKRPVITLYLEHLFIAGVFCNTNDCYVLINGVPKYYGTRNVTLSGIPCQRWDVNFPHILTYPMSSENGNYCRNPDNYFYIWCYTTNPNLQWERCDVSHCNTNPVLPETTTTTTTPRTTSSSCDHVTTAYPNMADEDICPCEDRQLYWFNYFHGNLSQQAKEEMIKDEKEKIKKELFLDSKTLTSYRIKGISAKDERRSSVSMGTASVVILITIGMLIVLSDVMTIFKKD